jgi:hypothetical protein
MRGVRRDIAAEVIVITPLEELLKAHMFLKAPLLCRALESGRCVGDVVSTFGSCK